MDLTAPGTRPLSQLSLDSVYSSGYESIHSESRTATPTTDLPSLEDFSGPYDACSLLLNQAHSFIHSVAGDFADSTIVLCSPKRHDKRQVCSDNASLSSCSTTFSSTSYCKQRSTSTPSKSQCDSLVESVECIEENCDSSAAATVIHKLKRRSDGWTGPLVTVDDPITSRLKQGRAEAIRRKEVIDVSTKPMYMCCL